MNNSHIKEIPYGFPTIFGRGLLEEFKNFCVVGLILEIDASDLIVDAGNGTLERNRGITFSKVRAVGVGTFGTSVVVNWWLLLLGLFRERLRRENAAWNAVRVEFFDLVDLKLQTFGVLVVGGVVGNGSNNGGVGGH